MKRFVTISGCVALAHIAISLLLFTVALAGIGAMTASQAQTAKTAWNALAVWNFVPIAVTEYWDNHSSSFRLEQIGGPGWTQDDQNALSNEIQFQRQFRNATFSLWPLLVGSLAGGADFLLRKPYSFMRWIHRRNE